ncbi:MAG: hypothetical protein H0U21_05185 [Acidimicrobiia bacterium]|nr:hypothetical protein [Acidimicrobiia bacterium]
MNQMKTRLQSLGLLHRAIRATTDDELATIVDGLKDDHREAVERLTGAEPTPEAIRAAATKGRLDGGMESLAVVLTDASLADCIEQLGDHSDSPTTEQLTNVLPGIVERHGVGATRIMLASTVAGEGAASAVIRDLLKHDELVKLPPAEPAAAVPARATTPGEPDPEREALKTRRLEQRRRRQEDARQRREQSARARHRA